MACGGSKSTEFFNFYPTNHVHYGIMDLFGWRNLRDLEAGFNFVPAKPLQFVATYHFFQLHQASGRWSNAGGANVGIGWDPNNTENNLGHEIDAVLTYRPWEPLMFRPGYGVFLPTGAGSTLGGPHAQHFAYLWLVFTMGA